ncbi:MAG TPA: asparagine synthase C-terminal domain-containing protein [Candidatus Deferrimicrobiaceae bacterium]|nr:asparagine synthase C-terminal domain-containing protein [Candidatus Deferrimicrobiaceae bacterium]
MSINETEVNKLLPEVRTLINKCVKLNLADGFLFSAGTDTQIIAYEAVKYKPDIPCLTLAFKHGQPKDTQYVKRMVELLHLKHETYEFGKEDVFKFYPKVVEALKKFDPMEIRNSLPVYIGLTLLNPKGIKTVFTGDALDELFGYPWQFHLTEEQFAVKQQEMWAEMGFSSIPMAASMGMTIKAPYMDPEFMEWAKKLPIKYKINMYNGVKYGKWILRKAYEDVIPQDVIWRPKAPLEAGTGTETLRTYFNDIISDKEFNEKKAAAKAEDDVEIQDKEQMMYYEVFRKKFGKTKDLFPKTEGAIQCPKCKSWQKTKIQFCKICGTYPI